MSPTRTISTEFSNKADSWELLEGDFRPTPLEVPEVRLDGRVLRYDRWLVKVKANVEGALEDFLKLEKASDDEIARFAKKWGPLRLCEVHGLFASHGAVVPPAYSELDEGWTMFCPPNGGSDKKQFESLRHLKSYVAFAAGLIRIAKKLHHGDPLSSEDWRAVVSNHPLISIEEKQSAQDFEREVANRVKIRLRMKQPWEIVARDINTWLLLAGARPQCTARKGGIDLGLSGDPSTKLAGELGIQLMKAISRVEGLALCAECGVPFIPRRRPVPGEDRYCKNCGLRAAWRAAARRGRQKSKHSSRRD